MHKNITYREHLQTILRFEIGVRQVQSSLNFEIKSETESHFCEYQFSLSMYLLSELRQNTPN